MSETEKLKDFLFNTKKCGWETLADSVKNDVIRFSDEYIHFLNRSKTEREATGFITEILDKNGFVNIKDKMILVPGDKVYYVNREKSVYAAIMGNKPVEAGLNIIGSHIDSPRLDLKPNPLYEDNGFAYFKTHYYGGVKKYQWTTIPLSIHGVIVKANGEKVTINIGEEESDPIFTITDLLPHLAQEQMEKKLKDGIAGEDLNLLIGSIPIGDEKTTERIKLNVLKILNDKYGITEKDFVSSELELVPAFKARSLGFDRSMVAGYGQDDKICAYTSLRALLDKVFCNSKMLSADVDAGLDPIYASVSEKNNAAFLGMGVGLNKYTGARGKSGASDANAEFVAQIRNIFESNNIAYQVSELGKVDTGGGGTIAYILANKGVDVIDCGVPVLSMHAPYEVTSKFDVYEAYRAYAAFWKN